MDAIRCAKLALDRKLSGSLVAPSSYFMKSPPVQFTDDEARIKVEEFIRGDEELVMPEPSKRTGSGRGSRKAKARNGAKAK